MKHNMGKTEKVMRVLSGIVLFLVGWLALGGFNLFMGAVTGITIIGIILVLLGAASFITGVLSYCPVNALLHLNSCNACKVGETHAHMPV